MALLRTPLPENSGRPVDIRDFDWRPGFGPMVERRASAGTSVWSSRRTLNCVGAGLLLLAGAILGALWCARTRLVTAVRSADLADMGTAGVVGLALGFVVLVGLALALQGRHLIVDRTRNVLIWSRPWWPCPTATLHFTDVRALLLKPVEGLSGVDDAVTWTHMVIIAELYDGRMVSLASDSPGLFACIRDALEAGDCRPRAETTRSHLTKGFHGETWRNCESQGRRSKTPAGTPEAY